MPDAWVAHGASLQLFAGGHSALTVRLGIDFGTAFTKLAIGLAGKVFFVDWAGIDTAAVPYLLSGALSETPNGAFVGSAPDASNVSRDLKLPFVGTEHRSTLDDRARGATFLAWIMRYARAWLYHHHANVLRGSQLIWEVNLGAPTGSWAAGTEALLDEYRQMGLVAWRCSQEPKISLTRTMAVLADTAAGEAGWGLDYLGVLPEFAAQIAGFVHSAQRKDGLYMLTDVGAGTLDVACFRIFRHPANGENKFPVFASSVEPLGTHYLMRVRTAMTNAQSVHWRSTHRVPSAIEFAEAAGVPLPSAKAADLHFRRLIAEAVNPVLHRTRTEMDRNAREFARGGEVPVFLCGGGAHVDVYPSGIAVAFSGRAFQHRLRRFPPEAAPQARFRLDAEVAARMSVARGLTHDAESIGKFIPTCEIPPDLPPAELGVSRPDRDELYPK